jgi:hypothetical protein
MLRTQRNDMLLRSSTTRTLVIAAVTVAALILVLVVAYTALDLGMVLPRRGR